MPTQAETLMRAADEAAWFAQKLQEWSQTLRTAAGTQAKPNDLTGGIVADKAPEPKVDLGFTQPAPGVAAPAVTTPPQGAPASTASAPASATGSSVTEPSRLASGATSPAAPPSATSREIAAWAELKACQESGKPAFILARIGAFQMRHAEEIIATLRKNDADALAPHLVSTLWNRPIDLAIQRGKAAKADIERAMLALWNELGLRGKKPAMTVSQCRQLLVRLEPWEAPARDEASLEERGRRAFVGLLGEDIATKLEKLKHEDRNPEIAGLVKRKIIATRGEDAFKRACADVGVPRGVCPRVYDLIDIAHSVLQDGTMVQMGALPGGF